MTTGKVHLDRNTVLNATGDEPWYDFAETPWAGHESEKERRLWLIKARHFRLKMRKEEERDDATD